MPPAGLAATARCPGGYGIRPYAVGVDACIDSEPRRLPHVAFLGPSARGSARRRWGQRTLRLSEILRAMARFSPSGPAGHLPRKRRRL